jgi:hypothetical protein
MLAEVLHAEVDAYIAAFATERDEQRRRLVVRNGYHQPREVLTGAGEVTALWVSHTSTDPVNGERMRFSSAILPPWCRKTPKTTEVLTPLYSHGLSSGGFVPALGQFLGFSARLSVAVIADRAVRHAVDLGAPRRGRRQVTERRFRRHQVALGIADQILHDPLRLPLREGRASQKSGRNPNGSENRTYSGAGTTTFATTRPSSTPPGPRAPCPAAPQDLEALRQHRQRRGGRPSAANHTNRNRHHASTANTRSRLGCTRRSAGAHLATTPPGADHDDAPTATPASPRRPGGGSSGPIPHTTPARAAGSNRFARSDPASSPPTRPPARRRRRSYDPAVPPRRGTALLVPSDHPPRGLMRRPNDLAAPR